ncbi:MAG: hypothetical protein II232_07635, partial [Spirochaetaceae bacterium]|nr:hypothetical protein [Spirochaetaceae bacterium]
KKTVQREIGFTSILAAGSGLLLSVLFVHQVDLESYLQFQFEFVNRQNQFRYPKEKESYFLRKLIKVLCNHSLIQKVYVNENVYL